MEIRRKVNPLIYRDISVGDVFVMPDDDNVYMKCDAPNFTGSFALNLKTGMVRTLAYNIPVRKIDAVLDVDY